ncbi:hypothetical protein B9Z55_010891 [Caenorhabditis nigoni]|uniref:Uncharacterized protein n=1 Tax=Caenorhabditis nigoni TaxID=1611254 RepID=A0A2G5UHP1_9PELO|nr:hypothetical protein B9Z55_010891 [Caenorhabditis nigoni]
MQSSSTSHSLRQLHNSHGSLGVLGSSPLNPKPRHGASTGFGRMCFPNSDQDNGRSRPDDAAPKTSEWPTIRSPVVTEETQGG